ncbi:hypothetical protein ACH5RR_012169 [Cinchona calisaya]|uniref:Uncharacterized protein n=1 Tax=Cinchona calisaya TaxID=153742 RepID=A0ABD3A8K4_9GENT
MVVVNVGSEDDGGGLIEGGKKLTGNDRQDGDEIKGVDRDDGGAGMMTRYLTLSPSPSESFKLLSSSLDEPLYSDCKPSTFIKSRSSTIWSFAYFSPPEAMPSTSLLESATCGT